MKKNRKDELYLLATGLVCSVGAWLFFVYLGGKAFDLLMGMAFLAFATRFIEICIQYRRKEDGSATLLDVIADDLEQRKLRKRDSGERFRIDKRQLLIMAGLAFPTWLLYKATPEQFGNIVIIMFVLSLSARLILWAKRRREKGGAFSPDASTNTDDSSEL